MIKLVLDGDTNEITKSNFNTFEDFFKIINKELEKNERVIVQIKINNEIMSDGKQFSFFKDDCTNIDSVYIETKERAKIINDNLLGFKEQCDVIISNIDNAVESYRVGNEKESHQYFSNIIEGIRWFNYGLEVIISFLRVDFKDFKINDITIYDRVEELSQIIDSLSQSQDSGDWIMLADQLEFELKPQIESWKKNINQLNK